MDSFSSSFKQSFYLSEVYADFCSKITGIKYSEVKIKDKIFFIIKNKNPAINNYDDDTVYNFKNLKIKYTRVLNRPNYLEKTPSIIEYSILFKKSYEEAVKNYKHSFKEGLRQSTKYDLSAEIPKRIDENVISKVYNIYANQMKRLNSYMFPKSFFNEFIKLNGSLLFLVYYEDKIASYAFCFENKENLYISIAGGHEDYFKFRINNKLYDSIIKYACDKSLNIHFGIGIFGSGYQKFKENAGAINYKCERFPNDEKFIKIISRIINTKIFGIILRYISKKSPKRIMFLLVPIT